MKKSDLYREWARVLDMCEGTNVDPGKCVKVDDMPILTTPNFDARGDRYSFAVAILDNKPVFVGDKVYGKNTWYEATTRGWSWWCKESEEYQLYPFETPFALSWQPPKKTFSINGKELPCPELDQNYNFCGKLDICGGDEHSFTCKFRSLDERNKVADAIIKLLKDATK